MHVLVVDDSDQIADLVELVLSQGGHVTTVVRDGFELLLAPEFAWDVVDAAIVDLMLPAVGGFTLLRHIRDVAPHVRLVAFTAADDTHVAQAARVADVVARKGSVTVDELLAAVNGD